jgi:hypothetical protein
MGGYYLHMQVNGKASGAYTPRAAAIARHTHSACAGISMCCTP